MAAKPFRVIVADPPWAFADKLPGKGRGAAKHYPTLSVGKICGFLHNGDEPKFPIADDALLFMWRVASMQAEALDVIRYWGFTLKSELVWLKRTATGKRHFGMGRYTRAEHEVCLIASRGKNIIHDHSVRSTFEARTWRHSEKPDAFFGLVEKLAPGPYLELFARRHRPGWTCDGNELGTQEAAE
jgi:N6-adenosine-specific RNA methylase IME4